MKRRYLKPSDSIDWEKLEISLSASNVSLKAEILYPPLGQQPLEQKIFRYPYELIKFIKKGTMETTVKMHKQKVEDDAMIWGEKMIEKYKYNY